MSLSIKGWSEQDRPREKLLTHGASALSDAELIAILLGSGSRNHSAVDLAREVLNKSENNLNTLGKMSVSDLRRLKGIGIAKAVSIVAALELGRRRKVAHVPEYPQIRSSEDVFTLLDPIVSDLPHEEFWVLYLNRSNRVISRYKLSQGGISGTVTDIRLILKKGVELLASGIILCHNHPSGNKSPSESDARITAKLKEAGQLMDISLLDHIIVAGKEYYSFADNGGL